MAASVDSWTKECDEAERLANEISNMISERSSMPNSSTESQQHLSAIRAKIVILGTMLESLQHSLPSALNESSTAEEMKIRKDMVTKLRLNVNEINYALNMSNFANRDRSLEPDSDAISRTIGLDNQGIVDLQRQIMREQDEGLGKLAATMISTRHIALAVNEELSLHTRLVDYTANEHVEVTNSRLQRKLALLNKRNTDRCSCPCLVLSVIGIIVLIAIVYIMKKYL
ncbi:hypothetical protein ABFS82_08G171900 [Erythranthe guttata]|uniref:syntaxin-51-like n=1 Tax=Erythranthe guttata TaxID=4155 RepID=UPI00064DD69A|nr:PREDICTED: syntaxin-51-like [Erythranthe guttata]|eukprot:XP_012841659.1 PREDICTED: syntaxin-51-like [Erythranthe guttata]